MTTLSDLAGADLTSRTPVLDAATRPLLARAAAWCALHADLTDYRSPGPGDPQVHTDTLAIRRTLTTLAPLDGTSPGNDDANTQRVTALLTAATGVATDIADLSARTFGQLARSGHVHIHAATLTREQVGEDVDLAHAKVTGSLTPAPATRYTLTLDRYATVSQPLVPKPTPALDPTTAARPLDDAHVLTRTPPT